MIYQYNIILCYNQLSMLIPQSFSFTGVNESRLQE